MEDHGAEVALIFGRAAEVEELLLRTPSTRGTVGAVCGSVSYGRVGLQRLGSQRGKRESAAAAAGAAAEAAAEARAPL